jgi:hypothetical protein
LNKLATSDPVIFHLRTTANAGSGCAITSWFAGFTECLRVPNLVQIDELEYNGFVRGKWLGRAKRTNLDDLKGILREDREMRELQWL